MFSAELPQAPIPRYNFRAFNFPFLKSGFVHHSHRCHGHGYHGSWRVLKSVRASKGLSSACVGTYDNGRLQTIPTAAVGQTSPPCAKGIGVRLLG